jgi:hypothetical protein
VRVVAQIVVLHILPHLLVWWQARFQGTAWVLGASAADWIAMCTTGVLDYCCVLHELIGFLK